MELGSQQKVIGNYVSKGEVIGRGTFATVFRGYHSVTKREVAIKAMFPEKVQKKQLLQEREVEIMKSLRHENVVELLDVYEGSGSGSSALSSQPKTVYLVFELCAGGDFAGYLKKQPKKYISEEKSKHWVRQLAAGLRFLRSRNIVHRDLKPQNLLLSTNDESTAILKLADFGFARFINNTSLIETVCGTPLYMAPEILRTEKYSTKSDLWSVGCIIYEMVVGHAPFVVRTHYELIMKQENEKISFPPDAKERISGELQHLILSLLQKETHARISWKAFFGHAWLQGAAYGGSRGSLTNVWDRAHSTPTSDVKVPKTNPFKSVPTASASASPISPSPPGVAALMQTESPRASPRGERPPLLRPNDAVSSLQRMVDRALCVLELADVKAGTKKVKQAAVLYWKGLEALGAALAFVSEQLRSSAMAASASSYVEALNVRVARKLNSYRAKAGMVLGQLKRSSLHQLPSPSELVLDFALKMGRDGGVSEILNEPHKAEKLYENGIIMLEYLYSQATDLEDRSVLVDYLQQFQRRLTAVRTLEVLQEPIE